MTRKRPNDDDGRSSLALKHARLDHSEEQEPGQVLQFLKNQVDQLIAEHGTPVHLTDPRQRSERLRDIFVCAIWRKLRNEYDQMTQGLKRILETSLRNESIHAEVSGRTKEVDSVETTLKRREDDLIERNGEGFKDFPHIFHEMHDLCGLRIVLHYPDDLGKAQTLIRDTFRMTKDPARFTPDRKVGKVWYTWFGAYETENHRVTLAEENEALLPQYSGVMFEIQLTTLSNYLYNKLAHDLLYKGSDNLSPQDEMVIDLSHGLTRCYELCMRMVKDKLVGKDAAKAQVGATEETTKLKEALQPDQVKQAQLAVEEFEKSLQATTEPPGELRESIIERLSNLITQKVQNHLEVKQETADDKACLRDLRLSNPRHDKKRIEHTKGGLLRDSYKWILENDSFRDWREKDQSRLLWIKGDPGKGKTMLLCGIIDELERMDVQPTTNISYFFCQATDDRINSATAVLRGLIYSLVERNQYLLRRHLGERYDKAGKLLFEDANAWVALFEILENILRDPSLETTFFIIDALDECATDRPKLLDLIVKMSTKFPKTKWIVSSRNWHTIEEKLGNTTAGINLSLELNEDSISAAVRTYINYKVDQVVEFKHYKPELRSHVNEYLVSHANSTFLWVALVCQELARPEVMIWHTRRKLREFPTGLDALYKSMIQHVRSLEDVDLCMEILAVVSIAARPITLPELMSLVEDLHEIGDDQETLEKVIKLCGSFLTLQGDNVSFIHQSAKDFLSKKEPEILFPTGKGVKHQSVLSSSIKAMSKTLRRDIYNLVHPGTSLKEAERQRPSPDPLAPIRYACTYWVDHLCETSIHDNVDVIESFLRKHFLHWFEALSLLTSESEGMNATRSLYLLKMNMPDSHLLHLARDFEQFAQDFGGIIRQAPLQIYSSALIFSPAESSTRRLFKNEEPDWIIRKPLIAQERWGNPFAAPLRRPINPITYVAFSPDGGYVASEAQDRTVKLRDVQTGACTLTLKGRRDYNTAFTFLPDGGPIAFGFRDGTVKLWDAQTGACTATLKAGDATYRMIFDSTSSCLHTDVGSSSLDVLTNTTLLEAATALPQVRPKGCGMGLEGSWITWDGRRLLSLPHAFVPHAYDILRHSICIGCRSGQVYRITFSEKLLNSLYSLD